MTKRDDLVAILQASPHMTFPASALASRLGVSTRTIRSYVSSVNDSGPATIASSRSGYRLAGPAPGPEASSRTPGPVGSHVASRRTHLLGLLVSRADGIDVFSAAEDLHVSESTIEADLTHLRAVLKRVGLVAVRRGPHVRLEGDEAGRRRIMRDLLTTVAGRGRQFLDIHELARLTDEPALIPFRHELAVVLERHRLMANQRTADELTAHVAVLVDRVRSGCDAAPRDPLLEPLVPVATEVSDLIERLFDVRLEATERAYLGFLLLDKTAPADPAISAREGTTSSAFLDEECVRFVTDIVARLKTNYAVDLYDERFVSFLAVHVRNLVHRASRGQSAVAPIGQSVKNTHPLVHELAVFIAQQIELGTGVTVAEDEISFLAFHVGGRLQAMHQQDAKVRILLVAPRYYDVHTALAAAVEEAVGGIGVVDSVITDLGRVTADPSCDVVVSTVPVSPAPKTPLVLIPALPAREDLDRLRELVDDVAAGQRRFRAAAWLGTVMDPRLFLTRDRVADRTRAIALLSDMLRAEGCVGHDFQAQVLERERLSSTAFPSGAAIPHSMEMTAHRSAIAVCVSETPIDWDGAPVTVVALLALAQDSRESFGEVYDSFIRTLVAPSKVSRLRAQGRDFDAFVQTLIGLL